MKTKFDRLITFMSTHHAFKAEKVLKKKIVMKVIPTPHIITSSCGQSTLFRGIDEKNIVKIFKETNIQWSTIFKCVIMNCTSIIYEKLSSGEFYEDTRFF